MKPKRRFSQNFLTDKNIAKKIVDSLTYKINDKKINCVEIGGGRGILTEFLIQRKEYELFVIEIDSRAAEYLKNKFPQLQHKIIKADVLKLDFKTLFDFPLPLIGNLPYNITGPLFFKLLENRHLIPQAVCMVQREVANRIIANPGNKDYGILSVLLQAFYEVEYLFTVPPSVFYPKPKVYSAVIRLNANLDKFNISDYKKFVQVVKAAFNKRRKTLRNALKDLYFLDEIPSYVLNKRAEQLSVTDFVNLATILK